MKRVLFAIFIIAVALVGYFYVQNTLPPKPKAIVYHELRDLALNVKFDDSFKLNKSVSRNGPLGLIMEEQLEDVTYTLVVLGSGDVSIYMSSGVGFIGGIKHVPVRRAGIKALLSAREKERYFKKVDEYPLPDKNTIQFYALTTHGVHKAILPKEPFNGKAHPLADLYADCYRTITEFREVGE